MTFKALFSKTERNRIAKQKKEVAAAAEMAAKRAALRGNPEIAALIHWYEGKINGKKDSETNFVELGFEAHDRYWQLTRKIPEVQSISGHGIELPAQERFYSFIDDEGNWHNWRKSDMDAHYQSFLNQEEQKHFFGDYSLADTGPFGGGDKYPYSAVAYLSYSYYEKARWASTIADLKKLAA